MDENKKKDFYLWAKDELSLVAFTNDDLVDAAIREKVLNLFDMFLSQHNNGFETSIISSILTKLVFMEPLSPLTGEDDEWVEVGKTNDGLPIFKNIRCYKIYKYGDEAYNNMAVIYEDENGQISYDGNSKRRISFPYVPTVQIVKKNKIEDAEVVLKEPNND